MRLRSRLSYSWYLLLAIITAGPLDAAAVTPPTAGVGTTAPEAKFEVHGDQAGSNLTNPEPVFGLRSTPDQGNEPRYRVYQGRDQFTTGGTALSTHQWIGGIAATGNRTYMLEARVLVRCTGGTTCGTTAPSYYKRIVAVFRSYNSGANCALSGSPVTSDAAATISALNFTLEQNAANNCEFGIATTYVPANVTIQINYVLEVMELVEN